MDYKIEVNERASQPVMSVRKRTSAGDLPQHLGYAFTAIIDYLQELGEQPVDAPFAAYYNMDMEDLDVEAGFPVAKQLAGRDDIKAGEIPAGKQVSCIHKGPYMEMGPVYEAMQAWMAENGCIPTGLVYEFYYNSPLEVSESELLTKIVFLVK